MSKEDMDIIKRCAVGLLNDFKPDKIDFVRFLSNADNDPWYADLVQKASRNVFEFAFTASVVAILELLVQRNIIDPSTLPLPSPTIVSENEHQ